MRGRLLATLIIAAVIVVAVFGLYAPMMGHASHASICPFSLGFATLCSPAGHLEHWQDALMATFGDLLLLVFVALAFYFGYRLDPAAVRCILCRARSRLPDRPALLQELFSDGILNRKEPYIFAV